MSNHFADKEIWVTKIPDSTGTLANIITTLDSSLNVSVIEFMTFEDIDRYFLK